MLLNSFLASMYAQCLCESVKKTHRKRKRKRERERESGCYSLRLEPYLECDAIYKELVFILVDHKKKSKRGVSRQGDVSALDILKRAENSSLFYLF